MDRKMKLKYFMRGLGAGIVFTAIILTIFFQTSDTNKMSNADIKKEATKLGMVEDDEQQIDLSALKTDKEKQQNKDDDVNKNAENTANTTKTSDKTNSSTKKSTNNKEKTNVSETTNEGNKKEAKTTKDDKSTDKVEDKESNTDTKNSKITGKDKGTSRNEKDNGDTVKIVIKPGMYTSKVAALLVKKGLIDNEKSIIEYLMSKEWQEQIRAGVYEIPRDTTIGEVARILTNHD